MRTEKYELHHGDCREVMAQMPDNSVDAIVTDPPYGLSFMGKGWDHGVPGVQFWTEALRVAKPGAHLLAFGGTRTFHRLTCAIEDAGWEIRDCVMWVYGSGFPKSLDVSKALDGMVGAQREIVGKRRKAGIGGSQTFAQDAWTQANRGIIELSITAPATPEARQWSGWGTALKPAWEPVIVARKPLMGTVAANVLEHGTGAINVDGCRVDAKEARPYIQSAARNALNAYGDGLNGSKANGATTQGRWPANVIHDGSDEVVALFPVAPSAGRYKHPEQLKDIGSRGADWSQHIFKAETNKRRDNSYAGDTGSAARFFYCAKASKRDRDEGCEGLEEKTKRILGDGIPSAVNSDPRGMSGGGDRQARNFHPTVKPTDLMRYLCRLVTPPDGVILDPFMGSGSTGKAALLEGFRFIGIEREAEYIEIARARIEAVQPALVYA